MHIGIIMDGNRRFAKKKMLPAIFGHKEGFETLKRVISWCPELGVDTLTVYAFSTENWARAEEEVASLMTVFRSAFKEFTMMGERNIRVSFIGDRSRFDEDIQDAIARIEATTRVSTGTHVIVALSYGGRAEIIDAIHRIPINKIETITEVEFSALLHTGGVKDPDLIIRTSGEQRLSNFLPWQGVYAELKFTPTLWPDFSREEFTAIIGEYEERERRFGQ